MGAAGATLTAILVGMALIKLCLASQQPGTSASWLEQQRGGSVHAAGYPEAGRTCLKLENVQNCDFFGLASALYLE